MLRVELRLNLNVFESAQIYFILLKLTIIRLITQDELSY